jgi:hypothetical protein
LDELRMRLKARNTRKPAVEIHFIDVSCYEIKANPETTY